MRFCLRLLGVAASLALSASALAKDSDIPMHADRFVRALQQQRFDDAAAMFKPQEQPNAPATAAQLRRIATRIGGFSTMRNVLSLPDGVTLKFEAPSAAQRPPSPNRYHQVKYSATAADGQPVYYMLILDGSVPPQSVLWFEVQLPVSDEASRARAEQALRDLIQQAPPK